MANKAKQLKNNKAYQKRRAKVANMAQAMVERLANKLKELAVGKTYPEKQKAHVAFYHTCNEAEKIWLRLKFWEEENKDLNDGAIA